MEGILFGGGLGLFIALLAWSDQIKSLHRDTLEAEKQLKKSRNLDWKNIKILIRKEAPQEKVLKALNKMLKKDSEDNIVSIEILHRFVTLDTKAKQLEGLYNRKYNSVIGLTILFISSGIVSWFIKDDCVIVELGKVSIMCGWIPAIVCLLSVLATVFFILYLNNIETGYRNDFLNLLDHI